MLLSLTVWKILGSLGIWLIELSYVPQITKLYRRKTTQDISLLFPGLNLAGRLLAMGYSMAIGEQIFAIGFMLGSLMRATLLFQVIYYRWLRPRIARPTEASQDALGALGKVLPSPDDCPAHS